MLRVTAVVPNWNRKDLVERVLRQLGAQTHPIQDILVVDNGSEDGSVDTAEAAGARVLKLGSNRGFAAAVNRGIEESRTEWIAIVNNDVELAPDWLERLAEGVAGRDAWFATGKIYQSAKNYQSAAEGVLDGTFDEVSRAACAWRAGSGRRDQVCWSEPRRIGMAPFTAALFRASLFGKIGGLDERFESYLEDVDFGLRCALAGMEGWFIPGARAWHQGSATLGMWHGDTVRRIARNQVLLIAKHYPKELVRTFCWPILVGQLLWGLVATRHGGGLSYLKGKMEGLRLWRRIQRENEVREQAAAGSRGEAVRLREILEQSERRIFEIQKHDGFDLYWRLYFTLT